MEVFFVHSEVALSSFIAQWKIGFVSSIELTTVQMSGFFIHSRSL